jgi:hypothetical protein
VKLGKLGKVDEMTDEGDKARGSSGVVCTVVLRPDGKIRLTFDDVSRGTDTEPPTWTTRTHFTSNDYDGEQFLTCDLQEAQLADIGLALVSRLAVLRDRP